VSDCFRHSFAPVADVYERGRRPYADAAIEWIAKRLPLGDVLDLAAGTGKLTRQLSPFARRVVAVEPSDGMRPVFAQVVAGVEVLAGTAEAIPLPDGPLEERTFRQGRTLTTDAPVEWVRSTSAVSTLPAKAQDEVEAEVRRLAGGDAVDVSIATEVSVGDRV
jgi:SAM-dependent methyltransferase